MFAIEALAMANEPAAGISVRTKSSPQCSTFLIGHVVAERLAIVEEMGRPGHTWETRMVPEPRCPEAQRL